MEKRPMIGVTPNRRAESPEIVCSDDIMNAVLAAGGLPVLLPLTDDEDVIRELVLELDGILFSGGCDIEPALYGKGREEACGAPEPLRDAFEFPLYRIAAESHLPILGICRGAQLINAAAGGTLCQDIPGHRNVTHPMHIREDSRLFSVIGKTEITVNSTHHQCVDTPAPGFRVAAESEEGIRECVEWTGDDFRLAIQWHPEALYRNDPAAAAIFRAFIEAAKK